MKTKNHLDDTSVLLRIRELHEKTGALVAVNYDISGTCNLRCEGCLYFEGEDAERHSDCKSLEEWTAQFATDADRGVTLAYFAGAEPSLVPERILAAQAYIPYGIVFTNGTVKLPDDISYRIHISAWGLDTLGASLRAGDVLKKALNNYRGDPRAVLVFTISALNIDQVYTVAELAQRHELPLTFSYYSPTIRYLDKLHGNVENDKDHFRISNEGSNLILARSDYALARREIDRAMEDFPDTIEYSRAYDDWVTSEGIYEIDPVTGVAKDCGVRLTQQTHVRVDLSPGDKCCSPNIDCRDCRAYAMAYTTYFTRLRQARHAPGGLAGWVEAREVWTRLLLPLGILE